MNPCLSYPHTAIFVETTPDEYGSDVAGEEHTVKVIFEQNTGFAHNNNQDAITSDAILYVNPNDEFVSDNFYRLEEFLVKINPYGDETRQSWFKVTSVAVAKDTQLCDGIDNIELTLKKTAAL